MEAKKGIEFSITDTGETLHLQLIIPKPHLWETGPLPPAQSGVYSLWAQRPSEDYDLMYIGEAVNLRQRLGSHEKRRKKQEPRFVRWITVPPPMRHLVESFLIGYYMPPDNDELAVQDRLSYTKALLSNVQ